MPLMKSVGRFVVSLTVLILLVILGLALVASRPDTGPPGAGSYLIGIAMAAVFGIGMRFAAHPRFQQGPA